MSPFRTDDRTPSSPRPATARLANPFDRMILAEAVAEWRRDHPAHPGLAPAAARAANLAASDPIEAIAAEAALQPEAAAFEAALARLHRMRRLLAALLALAAAIGGAAAISAALPGGDARPVNTLWIIGGFLGTQSLLLLLSLALLLPRRAAGSISLGGLLVRGASAIAGRIPDASRETAGATLAALRRWSAANARTPIGRWRVGGLSNLAWLSFNLGGLLAAVVLLSVRQYRFGWETTILPAAAVERAVETVAFLPRQLGLAPPSADEISASRFDPADPAAFPRQDDATRAAWSRLLLGSIALYGAAPRLLLALLCNWRLQVWQRRYRPDPTDPAVAAAIARLRPLSRPHAAGEAIAIPAPLARQPPASPRPDGPPAIVGVEFERPRSGWPPPFAADFEDLGVVEDREGRRRIVSRLAGSPTRPRPLLIAVDLAATPDRGIASAIGELAAAAGGAIALLSGGERLRRREAPESAAQRLRDWHRALEGCVPAPHGSPVAIEADLDHLTPASIAAIEAAIATACGGRATDAAAIAIPSAALDECFAAIAAAAPSWCRTPPDAAARADLHRRIARIYESGAAGGDLRWPLPPLGMHDPAGSLRRAADRAASLLPQPLRLDPRWLAAGAATGVLGCLAAAAMATPLAISSLPLWAATGSAAAALLDSLRRRGDGGGLEPHAPDTPDAIDLFEPIAAAALQAVLFEYQGRGEATISKRLEAAAPRPAPRLANPEQVRRFLADLRAGLAAAEASR